jgi:glycylpeptide N-tetradecanoyltransferase
LPYLWRESFTDSEQNGEPKQADLLAEQRRVKERNQIKHFLTTETDPSLTKSSQATIPELFAKLMAESPSDIDKPNHDESYRSWKTQPVPQFNENRKSKGGPIKVVNQDEVPKEPYPLLDGFEWGTIDPENEKEVGELYELLSNHYVEDDDLSFRLNYSPVFLRWSVNSFLIKVFFHHTHQMTSRALTAPGWQKQWNIAVRASASQKLVAFITG